MLTKNMTSLLICATMLVATVPSKALAQTLSQPAPTRSEQSSRDVPAKPKRDLRAAFEKVLAKSRTDAVSEEGIKRIEKEGLNPQSTRKQASGYTKKEKVLVISIVAGLVVLAVVL